MPDHEFKTKSELLSEIDRTWNELENLLDRLTEAQLTGPKDAAAWTVKDHLTHIVAWERTVIFFLQGKPRYEGLDVDKALWESGDYDGMNAAVQKKYRDLALPDALELLHRTHKQITALLQPLSDADLHGAFRPWRAGEEGEGEGPALIELLEGNTNGHYEEHLPWIQAILDKTP